MGIISRTLAPNVLYKLDIINFLVTYAISFISTPKPVSGISSLISYTLRTVQHETTGNSATATRLWVLHSIQKASKNNQKVPEPIHLKSISRILSRLEADLKLTKWHARRCQPRNLWSQKTKYQSAKLDLLLCFKIVSGFSNVVTSNKMFTFISNNIGAVRKNKLRTWIFHKTSLMIFVRLKKQRRICCLKTFLWNEKYYK